MLPNPYQQYRATKVETAGSVDLVVMLYQGAVKFIRLAIDALEQDDMKAAHGASLKTIKLGGLQVVHDAAMLCEKLDMKVNLACKIAEAGIASAGLLHLAASIPSLDWGVSLSSPYLSDDLVADPITLDGGFVNVPTGPGLGIRVDEAKVRRYTKEV